MLSSPLYPGALLTVFQSYLLIFQYAVRHSLTTKVFTELLQLLSLHTPQGAGLPKSVYKLKHFFIQAFPEANCIAHPYCSYCHRPLPLLDAGCAENGCGGGRPTEFVTIPLGPQIKRMMEDPDTWENLQKRLKRSESDAIKDIYDGVGYNKHSDFLTHPAHISLLFNTDGVAMFRSSKISIWPVWAVVNELPPTLRCC